MQAHQDKLPIAPSLQQSVQQVQGLLHNCADVVYRPILIGGRRLAMLVFINNVIDSEIIREHLIAPLQKAGAETDNTSTDYMLHHTSVHSIKQTDDLHEAVNAVVAGQAVLLVDGIQLARMFDTSGGQRRSVSEPSSETVLRGPREGFTESLAVNLSLIRFKLKTARLRTIEYTLGRESRTKVMLAYIDGTARPDIIEEIKKRLTTIDIDSVLESGYIEELIEDDPFSPFPQLQHTERPDTTAAQLLEGRFAILVDGTPFVLIGPVSAWQFLQASEDYYERYLIANLLRVLRLGFMMLALFLPAVYIAVITFHPDLLPTTLVLSIASAREAIPFPALVEALIMEVSFEALREAGIRLPKAVGQAVSILGALVIGQSAVQAGIVSAPMVIIVSMTGIASFCLPRFNFAISIRLLRFPLMVLAGSFGLFGIVVGAMCITFHLCQLQSIGVPYLAGVAPYSKHDAEDVITRVPWWRMRFRPSYMAEGNRERLGASYQQRKLNNMEPEW